MKIKNFVIQDDPKNVFGSVYRCMLVSLVYGVGFGCLDGFIGLSDQHLMISELLGDVSNGLAHLESIQVEQYTIFDQL